MKIDSISVRSFRTLLAVDAEFPGYFTAVSGRNNAGKTNFIAALRKVFHGRGGHFNDFISEGESPLDAEDDFPAWPEHTAEKISIKVGWSLTRERDQELYDYLAKLLAIDLKSDSAVIESTISMAREPKTTDTAVLCNGKHLESFQAQEFMKKVNSLNPLLFYNSVDMNQPWMAQRMFTDFVGQAPPEARALIDQRSKELKEAIRDAVTDAKDDFTTLLREIGHHQSLDLAAPQNINFNTLPLILNLSDAASPIPLSSWGSGTRNRISILKTVFDAARRTKRSSQAVTPIVVIEEPESFLHPSAQAEFGRALQQISERLSVQVVVTTHSPFVLSQSDSRQNLLLERRTDSAIPETCVTQASGDDWARPYSLALGIPDEKLFSLKKSFFSVRSCIILCEGEIDKAYLENLQGDAHGSKALEKHPEIVSFDGTGNIKNSIFVKFLKDKHEAIVILVDQDELEDVRASFEAAGCVQGVHFLPVGRPEAGSRNIEGLIPDDIHATVQSQNPGLLRQILDTKMQKESKSAKSKYKQLLLAEFKQKAAPGGAAFVEFYKLSEEISRCLAVQCAVKPCEDVKIGCEST